MHFLVSWFVETGNGNSVTTQKAQGYRYILWVWWRKLLAGGRDISLDWAERELGIEPKVIM